MKKVNINLSMDLGIVGLVIAVIVLVVVFSVSTSKVVKLGERVSRIEANQGVIIKTLVQKKIIETKQKPAVSGTGGQ